MVVLVLLSYPNCTLQTSTQGKNKEKKREKKQKNIWQWFVKGCFSMRCFTHFRSWKAWQFVSGGFKNFSMPNQKENINVNSCTEGNKEIIYTFLKMCGTNQNQIQIPMGLDNRQELLLGGKNEGV